MPLPNFTIGVAPSTLSRPTVEVVDYSRWSLDQNLDDGCTLSFDTRGVSAAAQAIDELATDVWLYQSGIAVQRFRVTAVEQTWGPDGDDVVTVSAICYRRLLQARTVQTALTYTATSQGVIVWNLIQHTQAQTNGNLGITLVSSGPAVLRTISYNPGTNILGAIKDFTIIENPLAWEIDANLGLSVYDPATYPLIAQPIVLGANARKMQRPSAADRFANAALVVGNNLLTAPVTAAAPGLSTDPRGRWERVYTQSNEADPAALQQYANGLVTASVSPLTTWRVDMDPVAYFATGNYQTGDYVTLAVPRSAVYAIGQPAPTVTCQVIARQVSGNADGQLTINLSLIETS